MRLYSSLCLATLPKDPEVSDALIDALTGWGQHPGESKHEPEQQPDDKPEQQPDEEPEQQRDEEPEQQPDDKPEQQPDDESEQQPDDKPEQQPDEEPEQQPDEESEQQPDEESEMREMLQVHHVLEYLHEERILHVDAYYMLVCHIFDSRVTNATREYILHRDVHMLCSRLYFIACEIGAEQKEAVLLRREPEVL